MGSSIAVDGICLTVVDFQGRTFGVEAVTETLKRTTLDERIIGDEVNLEQSLAIGDTLGGHWVTGHIDTVGKITRIENIERDKLFYFEVPKRYYKHIVEKGSIAVDGISLTVIKPGPPEVSTTIIPYTLEVTTLGNKKPGDSVNIETDILAKYIERISNLKEV